MYNPMEVAQFGSAETKLKQLQLKFQEADAARKELKLESQQLKRNLNLVSSGIPPQMADRLDNLLSKIAFNTLENFDLHIQQLNKTNQSQIKVIDMQSACQKALMEAFELIGRRSSYHQVVNSLSSTESQKKQVQINEEQEIVDSDESNDEQPYDSMAALIMGFSKTRRQKAPELPPRSDEESVISTEEHPESFQAH